MILAFPPLILEPFLWLSTDHHKKMQQQNFLPPFSPICTGLAEFLSARDLVPLVTSWWVTRSTQSQPSEGTWWPAPALQSWGSHRAAVDKSTASSIRIARRSCGLAGASSLPADGWEWRSPAGPGFSLCFPPVSVREQSVCPEQKSREPCACGQGRRKGGE